MPDLSSASPVLLVVAIFLARIGDVSLATVRTILVFRGQAVVASLIGFVEVLIWLAAAVQVLQDLTRWYLGVAYAAGFATGNWVGVWIERKMALGRELVRVMSFDPDVRIGDALREAGVETVELTGRADRGRPVEILFLVVRRRRTPDVIRRIRALDPAAVVTVADVKHHDPEPIEGLPVAPATRRLLGFAKRK